MRCPSTAPAASRCIDNVLPRRTDTYSIRIPADLPPSFRGKSIKFNYHLVVGSNRVALGPAVPTEAPRAGRTKGSVSRVMRVPLRVYNHVGGALSSVFARMPTADPA